MIEDLRSILNPSILINLIQNKKGNEFSVVLEEEAKNAKLKFVEIQKLSEDTLVFSLDYKDKTNSKNNNHSMPFSPYLNKKAPNDFPHINKSCDYVLVRQGETIEVILIDLKSEGGSGWTIQVDNSKIFVKYLLSIIENYKKINFKIDDVPFTRRSIKLSSKPTPPRRNISRVDSNSFICLENETIKVSDIKNGKAILTIEQLLNG